jgi:hypothetical protein
MNATALGLQTDSIDCVVSCRVLQSLPGKEEKEQAVKEIAPNIKTRRHPDSPPKAIRSA